MRITLRSPANHDGGCVPFDTDNGPGVARWRGTPQSTGNDLDVEFDIRDIVDWAEVTVEESRREALAIRCDQMSISGTVLDVDENGLLALDLIGTVVLIDTSGEAPLGVVGQQVSFLVRDVEIYPTNV